MRGPSFTSRLIWVWASLAACHASADVDLPPVSDSEMMIVFARATSGGGPIKAAVFVPPARDEEARAELITTGAPSQVVYVAAVFDQLPGNFGYTPGPLVRVPCDEGQPVRALSLAKRVSERTPDGSWQVRTLAELPSSITQEFCVHRDIVSCGTEIAQQVLECPPPGGLDPGPHMVTFAYSTTNGAVVGTSWGCVFLVRLDSAQRLDALEQATRGLSMTSGWYAHSSIAASLLYAAGAQGVLSEIVLQEPYGARPVIGPSPELTQIVDLDGDGVTATEYVATTAQGGLLHHVQGGQACPGECLGAITSTTGNRCHGWCVREPPSTTLVGSPRVQFIGPGTAMATTDESYVITMAGGRTRREPIPTGLKATAIGLSDSGAIAAATDGVDPVLLARTPQGTWMADQPLSGHVRVLRALPDIQNGAATVYAGKRGVFGVIGLQCEPIFHASDEFFVLVRVMERVFLVAGRPNDPAGDLLVRFIAVP